MDESNQVEKLYENLLNSRMQAFPLTGKVKISEEQGVYIIYSQNNEVLHVGKTNRAKNGLNQRLQNHLTKKSSFSNKYATPNAINLRQEASFKFIEIPDARLRTFTEALAVGKLCPKHVGTGEKK